MGIGCCLDIRNSAFGFIFQISEVIKPKGKVFQETVLCKGIERKPNTINMDIRQTRRQSIPRWKIPEVEKIIIVA